MNVEQRWVLADRAPVRNWSDGRVTLLGDAAHPTLQSHAQGACMALEDAAILANMLDASAGLRAGVPALPEAPTRAPARAAGSRAMWDFYHCDGIEREVRDSDICHRTLDDSTSAWRGCGTACRSTGRRWCRQRRPGRCRKRKGARRRRVALHCAAALLNRTHIDSRCTGRCAATGGVMKGFSLFRMGAGLAAALLCATTAGARCPPARPCA